MVAERFTRVKLKSKSKSENADMSSKSNDLRNIATANTRFVRQLNLNRTLHTP